MLDALSECVRMQLCRKCYGSGVEIVFAPQDPSVNMGGWIAYWPTGPEGGLAYRRTCPACGGLGVGPWPNPDDEPPNGRGAEVS